MAMAVSFGSSSLSGVTNSSFPSSSSSLSSRRLTTCSKRLLVKGLIDGHRTDLQNLINAKGKSSESVFGIIKEKVKHPRRRMSFFANCEDDSSDNELISDASYALEPENQVLDSEDFFPESSFLHFERSGGKPGFISFHGRPIERRAEILEPTPSKQSNLFWFIGPSVLVASFIFPSLYLRRIFSSVFEDSLLTDFLILFFTEGLFYCGVAIFLLMIDHFQKPLRSITSPKNNRLPTTQLVHRVSSVATLALSLIIPMVTMGLVWPWTGPAASATLAPYLVGIVVQFAFEQYARYVKSPSWPVIPVIFQVYRLHQLNRAAQLVTALSFTVRGAETTSHNLAINSSLGTLLNVLQFLGVICIWSLASFIMRFLPTAALTELRDTQ